MQYSTITTLNSLIINSISTSAFFISASVFCACFALIVIGFALIPDFLELLLVGIVGTILLAFAVSLSMLLGMIISFLGIIIPLMSETPAHTPIPLYFRISLAISFWTIFFISFYKADLRVTKFKYHPLKYIPLAITTLFVIITPELYHYGYLD